MDALRAKRALVAVSGLLVALGSAAMLPMAGQVLAKAHPGADISALSACIIAAQLVMVGIAAAVGWALRRGIGGVCIHVFCPVHARNPPGRNLDRESGSAGNRVEERRGENRSPAVNPPGALTHPPARFT